MDACFSISSARCGLDDDKYELIAGSAICSPEGNIIAEAQTDGDELVVVWLTVGRGRRKRSTLRGIGGLKRMDLLISRLAFGRWSCCEPNCFTSVR